ncbi:MAG: Fe-S-cluster-containing hydrogenase [Mariniblastus sp.]|nr:Fe-S-cluster-containing hydrogenase [Mariniblastus sp.]
MNKPKLMSDIDQIDQSPELQEAIERDFGSATSELQDGFSRRRWLQLMGASLALGGMSGCRYKEEKIAPYAFRPQNRIPGVPEKFATTMDFGGVAQPLLATCFDGRPIKLDGNAEHPCSLGASTAYTQASILELYDPERLRTPMQADTKDLKPNLVHNERNWEALNRYGQSLLGGSDLSSVALLSEQISSPTMLKLKKQLEDKGAKWFIYSSINEDNQLEGSKIAFGKPLRPHYQFDQAAIILTIDADPLFMNPNGVGNAHGFTQHRNPDEKEMSRLYAVESQFTHTGAAADHRISVTSSDMAGFVGALAAAIDSASGKIDPKAEYREKMIACIAQDLVDHKGAAMIVCGERQPAAVHAAVHALNDKLGNNGKTILFTELPESATQNHMKAIQDFVSGDYKTAVILGGNPVFTAPHQLEMADKLRRIENTVYLGQYRNETARCCQWIGNPSHPLESWGDATAYDGSTCVGQPLIRPLFNSLSEIELLATWMNQKTTDGMTQIKENSGLSDQDWALSVHDGFIKNSAAKPVDVTLAADVAIPAATDGWRSDWDGSSLELVFTPSSSVYDGRFANNAWLQELPDFMTKLTWDNALLVSPNTYDVLKKNGIRTQMIANVQVGDKIVGLPVLIQPGQADGSLGVAIGYGRTAAGRVGGDGNTGVDPVGVNVNPLRSVDAWHFVSIDEPTETRTAYRLALVQEPWNIDTVGRDEIQSRMFYDKNKKESNRSALIREGSLESYKSFLAEHPIEHHDDEADHSGGHALVPSQEPPPSLNGSLPVLNNVSFVQPLDDQAHSNEHGDEHGHGGHGHAHWPEAFHLHHENFDITPGSRRVYEFRPNDPNQGHRWGMTIDLSKCLGCNACVIACQAENNVPVVGKDDVWRGREMHWLRIDRYYGNNLYNSEAKDKMLVHQPVACHHCENAPCETVCPVAATVHSSEGLNDMVYNRCIGTRYCGNNCPYKVRRFNFFNYTDAVTFLKYPGADKLSEADQAMQNLMMNPEVTIRSRGVMEKCTYCVQRIQHAKIQAKNEHRKIGPNEIRTACQDACGADAVQFGDLANIKSNVRKAYDNPRSYAMLDELNNVPRTKYLAKVRNVNPALMEFDDRDAIRGYEERHPEPAE